MSQQIQQTTEYSVDLRPLDQPENPFAIVAASIRARYQDLTQEDEQTVAWLESLAQRSPNLTTTSRLIALVLGGAATDFDQRALLAEGIAVISEAIGE